MKKLQSSQFNNEGDDEVYEKIEAPKFVDFTIPDLSRPDDKSWFCLRVGCDQKHEEEEMDPDALYKSFVLRVMAARSPNLRLRKTLIKQALNTNMKCPLSAPAKSSKARISRLMAITSISQKMIDAKVKVRPLPKLNSTPNAKAKQLSVAPKSLTTPSYKKCPANSDSFRSVQNPKTTVVVPKNREVAKVLVFHSPKKIGRTKTSLGRTSVTKISVGKKKLDIIGQRKHVLGYSCKLSRDTRRDNNKSSPSNPSRRKLSARKIKIRAEVSFLSRDGKGQEAKSSRHSRKQSKGNLERCQGSVPREVNDCDSSDMEMHGKSRDGSSGSGSSKNKEGNGPEERQTSVKTCNLERYQGSVPQEVNDYDSSDMEIDGKSRDGSSGSGSSGTNEGNGHEECLTSVKTSGNFGSSNATQEESIPSSERSSIRGNPQSLLSIFLTHEVGSLSNSEENFEENDPPKFRTSTGKGDESNEGSGYEENIGSNSEEEKISEEDLPVHQTLKGVGDEKEAMESDDKENASASDYNRELNPINHSEKKILGGNEVNENPQKVIRVLGKAFKESSASAANGSQGEKYKKTKPTNPKPFRLRTDERGILKEANLKRRLHLFAPLKETATVPKFPNRNSHKSHGNEIQQNGKSQGKCKHEKDEYEGNHIGSDKGAQKAQSQQMRPAYLKMVRHTVATPKTRIGQAHHKPDIMTVHFKDNKDKEDGKDKAAQKIDSSLIKVKSPMLRQQLVRPQRATSSVRKEAAVSVVSAGQLSVIEETPSTISRPKEAATITNSAAAPRSSSRGRRPPTIPKEPNFHSIHVPKSCTKKLA
ncbi:hypothetical protein HHK36_009721 [Tetracentron sinense]|uniref:Uncharacterized protein n=1 Tax=Tetracentron sinense TaxID=13715 RepID=A0A834ZD73_TETSI|nr:hypothetical protein HHK36_009721 [Tetracentron sinense]